MARFFCILHTLSCELNFFFDRRSLETIPFSIKMCVIAYKNKREDFRQLASFLFVGTTCFGQNLQAAETIALTLI